MSQGTLRGVRRSTKIREGRNFQDVPDKVQMCKVSQIIEKVVNLDLETCPFRFGYLRAFLLVHRFWKHYEAQLARVLQKIRFFFVFNPFIWYKGTKNQQVKGKVLNLDL